MATASLAQGRIGLGRALPTLAVAERRRLARNLRGRLRVISSPGAGPTVTAEVPCAS